MKGTFFLALIGLSVLLAAVNGALDGGPGGATGQGSQTVDCGEGLEWRLPYGCQESDVGVIDLCEYQCLPIDEDKKKKRAADLPNTKTSTTTTTTTQAPHKPVKDASDK